MAYVFQTFDKNGKPHKKWKFQYRDWQGRRRTATGYPSEGKTRNLAARIQAEHEEIRKGYRPPPTAALRHGKTPFDETAQEYLRWGQSQGGRGGRPWSAGHARMRRSHLQFWQERVNLAVIGDLDGVLPRVERVLQELQGKGRAIVDKDGTLVRKARPLGGKTLANYAESLHALCEWCVARNYLDRNPLERLGTFDTTSQSKRRALTAAELGLLLRVSPDYHRLLYTTAVVTGLRANELRSLTIHHLDRRRGALLLDADWTKNRKPGIQQLPPWLMRELAESADSGVAEALYAKFYRTKNASEQPPENPLLYVPRNCSRIFARDRAKAGIAKWTPEGKVDFHSLRVTCATIVIESGANVKEAQSFMRHSTPDLTMNTYARTRPDRMTELAATVGDFVQTAERGQTNVTGTQRLAAGAESYCPESTSGKRDKASIPAASTRFTGAEMLRAIMARPARGTGLVAFAPPRQALTTPRTSLPSFGLWTRSIPHHPHFAPKSPLPSLFL